MGGSVAKTPIADIFDISVFSTSSLAEETLKFKSKVYEKFGHVEMLIRECYKQF